MASLMLDFSSYIVRHTHDFIGREWVFKEVDCWLSKPDASRYFLLTGNPGSGKTALAARLVQMSDGLISISPVYQSVKPGVLSAIHFCSAREGKWINPHAFIESIALQLAARFPDYALALAEKSGEEKIHIDVRQHAGSITGEGKQIGVFIEYLDVSRVSAEDAFMRVIAQPLEVLCQTQPNLQVVILVDGLDEALMYSGEIDILRLLAQTEAMADNVRLLLTSRRDARIEAEFPDAEGLFLSADRFNKQNDSDVQDYVERKIAGDPALTEPLRQLPLEQRQLIFETVTRKAAGNFLYITFLLNEVIAGKRVLTDLNRLPEGLDHLYHQSLTRLVGMDQKKWERVYGPIMGILAVAQSPLQLDQLIQLTRFDEGKSWSALMDLEQFVQTGEPETDKELLGYQLYHQSISDFLAKQYVALKQKHIKNRFYLPAVIWHKHIADYFWRKFHTNWSQLKDSYGLSFLAVHLKQSQQSDHLKELINPAWMRARYENANYIYDGFVSDLEIAWQNAYHELQIQLKDGLAPRALATCIRYALIRSSINSLSAKLVPELAVRAMETGLWPFQQLMSRAKYVPDASARVGLYESILRVGNLSVAQRNEVIGQRLATALKIVDEYWRVRALADLAPYLAGKEKEQTIQQALDAAINIELDSGRASALAALAPYLAASQLQEALDATLKMDFFPARIETLPVLAPYMTDDQLRQALVVTWELKHESESEREYQFAQALAALAPFLTGVLLQQALDVAVTIFDKKLCINTLVALAPSLVGDEKERALRHALNAARNIYDEPRRAEALIRLGPYLTGDLLQQTLDITMDIGRVADRAEVLGNLVPSLVDEKKIEVLQQTFDAAVKVEDGYRRANALINLIPYLAGEEKRQAVQQALDVAVNLDNESNRSTILAALAPHLTSGQLQEALDTTMKLSDEYWRADILARALASHLTGELLQQALDSAMNIGDEEKRANVLVALLPNLAGGQLQQALDAAVNIESEHLRSYVLIALAPKLTDSRVQQALDAAMNIEHVEERANVLVALVPNLTGRQLQQVLDAAVKIESEQWRANVLVALASHLAGEPLQQALDAAVNIEQEAKRAQVLAALAPHLTSGQLQQALSTTLRVKDEPGRVAALAALTPHLVGDEKERTLQQALDIAVNIHEQYPRAQALAVLTLWFVGEEKRQAVQQALDAAMNFENDAERADVLAALASNLTGSQLQQALDAAIKIESKDLRGGVLIDLAPYLTGELLQQALNAAMNIDEEWGCANILAALAPSLAGSKLQQALDAAVKFRNEYCCSHVLTALASYLTGELLQQALDAAFHLRLSLLVEALAALAPYLTDHLLQRALDTVVKIEKASEDEYNRHHAELIRGATLAGLAPYLVGEEKEQAFRQSLDAALRFLVDEDLSDNKVVGRNILVALAPHLTGDFLQRGLDAALNSDEYWRADILAALAPNLTGGQLQQALAAARKIRDENRLSKVLTALLPALGSDENEQALLQALDAAVNIKQKAERVDALAALAPYLIGQEKRQVFRQALDAVGDLYTVVAMMSRLGDKEKAQAWKHGLDVILEHLYRHSKNGTREEILIFCIALISAPLDLDKETLTTIASHIVEVCSQWEWQ